MVRWSTFTGQFVRMWAWLPTYTYYGMAEGQRICGVRSIFVCWIWSSSTNGPHWGYLWIPSSPSLLIHLYGPICKNVGVTTYLHILRHGGRSKNLWGQKYLCWFNLEFKHELSSLRLHVHPEFSQVRWSTFTDQFVRMWAWLPTYTYTDMVEGQEICGVRSIFVCLIWSSSTNGPH